MKLEFSVKKLKQLLEEQGFIMKKEPSKISPRKIERVNRYYKDFDIEKSYGIELGTRLTYFPGR